MRQWIERMLEQRGYIKKPSYYDMIEGRGGIFLPACEERSHTFYNAYVCGCGRESSEEMRFQNVHVFFKKTVSFTV